MVIYWLMVIRRALLIHVFISNRLYPTSGKIGFVITAIYVDDMISLSNNVEMLKREKAAIGNRFQVEDLGEIHHVLGMTVKLHHRLWTLSLSQNNYLQGVLKIFGMVNCKSVSTTGVEHWTGVKGIFRFNLILFILLTLPKGAGSPQQRDPINH